MLPFMLDQYGKGLHEYKVKALPSSYLIDKQGMIRYVANGHVLWDKPAVRKIIDNLLAEEPFIPDKN